MCDVAVIADDLTGANAAGSLLAAKGLKVLTSLGLDGFISSQSGDFDAVC
ncbi:MAG: four-carbon acid sugar kinase family protein [Desulfovibrionales bacterium]|nr:four-carbon acid sugar kinase family protein [Desulfovibrionales bacterium]